MQDAIETESPAQAGPDPRVTLADIEANIASHWFFTAAEGVEGAAAAGTPYSEQPPVGANSPLRLLTLCVLVLRNGTKVVGINYGAIDPAQHSAEKGRQEAYAHAVEQIWPLMGYQLRERLAGPTDGMVNRFLNWPVPADVYPDGTPGQPGRVGTNLLTYDQAKSMLAHVLG